MDIEFRISELDRRLANMIQLGRIDTLDLSGDIPKAKVRFGELVSPLLPFITERAGEDLTWWPIDLNEQVIVFSPSGTLSMGIILGSINQKRFPSPTKDKDLHFTRYSDGAETQYDKKAHKLSIILPSGGTTALVSDGGIKIKGKIDIEGDVTIAGDIDASGDITDHTRSMQADRDIYETHLATYHT
ncbi:phage baseplate assembly protein V [Teredinibacter sp. KSP-S5-2]|uniref:phage baseplate assembly protein V n=1 Tax=Teredinibacter sp. KSP-S5-2 TaxID=3034506 RepID=UPI0029352BA6|nr:phage baseplate assembly protein V [Teredinibacter sp. KSP-S5-2]WNO10546.1 phage baseplate assembly protein V [Teredinibacter sp. KSP-S5-2]